MTARVGRQVDFFFGGNSPGDQVQGVREKGVECNGEAIDITSDEDDGVRTLLTIPAEDQVNITLSGVTKDTRMKAAWFARERMNNITLRYPDGSTISGDFFMTTYTEGENYKEATTFQSTLQSSGVVTFTPG
ncbi:MAG TPA: phage tail tube protein [Candidatus Saccharimonadia bacterium]|jgi:predicted secreted protein|nr:phage tail tube protein [Candidatus Saccharimonadia bacterium]